MIKVWLSLLLLLPNLLFSQRIPSYQEIPNPIVREGRAPREISIELNNRGFYYYRNEQWINATHCFREAIVADPLFLLPHYNLACTLNIMRDRPEYEVDFQEIWDELYICRELDATDSNRQASWFSQRIFEDSDLASLRKYPQFEGLHRDPYEETEEEQDINLSEEMLLEEVSQVASLLRYQRLYEPSPWDSPGLFAQAYKQERIALFRMLGGDPSQYRPMYYKEEGNSLNPLLEHFEQLYKQRAVETINTGSISYEDYRELLFSNRSGKPSQFIPQLVEGGSSSYRPLLLAENQRYLMYFEEAFSSAMPGNIFSISFFDYIENETVESFTLWMEYESEIEDPYRNLFMEESLLMALHETEDQWLETAQSYGLQPNHLPLGFKEFPLESQGYWDIEIEQETLPSEDNDQWNSLKQYRLWLKADDGGNELILDESLRELVPLGWRALPQRYHFLIAVNVISWGFEGESDTVLRFIPVVLVKG